MALKRGLLHKCQKKKFRYSKREKEEKEKMWINNIRRVEKREKQQLFLDGRRPL